MNSPILSDLRAWLAGTIAACYVARATLNPWQYAEQKVYLDVKASAEPGMYSSLLTPNTRRMQELGAAPAVDPLSGHFVHTYVAMKASRTGLTEGGLNIIRWMPENQPGHVLYAIDSKDQAKAISKDRLKPTLESTLPDSLLPESDDDMGTFRMFLKNMTIELAGSYSEGVFANKWCRKIFLDECEVMAQDVGESTPIDLARSRGTTVSDFQLFLFSKPTLPGTRFHQEYLAGTQEKYFVPCPHCGHMQELIWGEDKPYGVKFGHCRELDGRWNKKRIAAETYYQCEKGCRIEEEHKRWMCHPSRAEWRITNPDFTPGVVSQHFSDLYSPFEKVSWANLALIWIGSQDSIKKIQHFWNNHLGLPFEQKKVTVTENDLLACRADGNDCPRFKFGELPWVPHKMVAISDVQDDVVKWQVWAYRGLVENFDTPDVSVKIETALIDYGISLGLPDLPALLEKAYYVRRGDGVPCFASSGLVDSGWSTYETYDFCIKNGQWFPTKGASITSGQLVILKEREHEGEPFIRYDYDDHSIKIEFYDGRIKRRRRDAPKLIFPSDLADEKHAALRAELISERQVVDKAGLVSRLKWAKHGPNDWGDAGKMGAVVALSILKADIEEIALSEFAEQKTEN